MNSVSQEKIAKNRRVLVYFKKEPRKDRFFFVDHLLRKVKDLILPPKMNSLELVFVNLCKGLEKLKIDYRKNLPFRKIKSTDYIIVLGAGRKILSGYQKPNKIVAGIGLMTHPSDWPTLFDDYPVKAYLQHSVWASAIYSRYFDNCKIWPVGIDTDFWQPSTNGTKNQLLVYVKFLWNKAQNTENLLNPILEYLNTQQISYQIITYGNYELKSYKHLLAKSNAMIFLCEHESQGLAYQEAMAMNVPIFAWNQGLWLDKNLATWGETEPIAASSVPYFDSTCGDTFKDFDEFKLDFANFYTKAEQNLFKPRDYILNHLTLEKSAERMLAIIKEVYQ